MAVVARGPVVAERAGDEGAAAEARVLAVEAVEGVEELLVLRGQPCCQGGKMGSDDGEYSETWIGSINGTASIARITDFLFFRGLKL